MIQVAVFNNEQTFLNIQTLGSVPSGWSLGVPLYSVDGRCALNEDFTTEDIEYLEGFEGVIVVDSLPNDWQYPPSPEEE